MKGNQAERDPNLRRQEGDKTEERRLYFEPDAAILVRGGKNCSGIQEMEGNIPTENGHLHHGRTKKTLSERRIASDHGR